MQSINRPSEPPAVLGQRVAVASRRRLLEFWSLDRKRRSQTSPPRLGVPSDDPQLVKAVSAMSGGRCAFCEARGSLVVHRFRPSGNALPLADRADPHLYYLWLADAWQNLLPICETCVPVEAQFPVDGPRANLPSLRQVEGYVERNDGLWRAYPPKEVAMLLDPCSGQRFERHLTAKLDGELIGDSRRGELTIAIFDLNRAERRNERYQVYQDRIDELQALLNQEVSPKGDKGWWALFDFSSQEFGGTWFLLLRRIARWIALEQRLQRSVTRSNVRVFFERLGGAGGASSTFASALAALRREDQSLRGGRWASGAVYTARTPMKRVQITDFKSIERLALEFGNATKGEEGASSKAASLMILGENATGKSSILEAIALSLASRQAHVALDLDWEDFLLDPAQLGSADGPAARRARVEIEFATGQFVRMSIEQGADPNLSGELGNHRVPVFAYGAFRRFSTGSRQTAHDRHIRNLFDAHHLANPEPWLKKLPAHQFDMVVRTLRDLLSIEGDFDVIRRKPGSRRLYMVTAVPEPSGEMRFSWTPFKAVSSGYRSMLAMVCDIMKGLLDRQIYEAFDGFETAQGVVLIDEIEAHLHPRWKMQVMASLRAALPGMTFVVTTHDPLCLRGMGDHEVVVLQRVASSDAGVDSEMPMVVEQMQDLPRASDLRVEQLLTSDFFQLNSTDDAAADRRLAHIADLMAARTRGGLARGDAKVLNDFEADISSALPVGSTEVHRLVQEAVAEFLEKRRDASSQTLRDLKDTTKAEILRVLEGL
ncbi:AAA family ATPase [Brevundimonas sp. DWR2-3-1b1]|uniref:AAA family ATPase n=1 Tax=unclassified Brevundimonas TaxID=2622653 RepID=UPI003CF61AAE